MPEEEPERPSLLHLERSKMKPRMDIRMMLSLAIWFLACPAIAQTQPDPVPHTSTLLASNAMHPSWCKANCGTNVIAFHKLNDLTGTYQIYSMAVDGSNQTCLSCTPYAQANLPGATCGPLQNKQCQQGNPEWAPNGDIVFQQVRSGCMLSSAQTVPGTGLCADLVECDPNFTVSCTTLATSGTGSNSGFLQYRFSADGTKLFGGHVVAQSGTCTAIFGLALAIRIFNWTSTPSPTATQIVYSGDSTLDGDLLPAAYMPGNTCSTAFVEGATTFPTSTEPVTKTLFFSMVGDTTQAMRQYSLDISSGDASTILSTIKMVSPGGIEWSEMGRINPQGTHYAYVSSTCTPDPPPVTIANVALDLAVQNPTGGSKICATSFNTPGSPEYYNKGKYVQFQDFDWGPADGPYSNSIVANVTDIATFDDIYLFVGTQVGPPKITSVVNGASFTPGFASGEWVTIFGENLAQDARPWASSDFVGNRLPTSLDGVSVKINGVPAYVAYINPTQINVLAPDDSTVGNVSVQVTTVDLTSPTFQAAKQDFVPTFFMLPPEGAKYVVATHADNSLVGNTSLYPGFSTPARGGEEIVLWATGFGPTTPPTPSGQLVGSPANLANKVAVTIGGLPASVAFSGVTLSGVDQINVVVPTGLPSGDQAVVATIAGVQSQANAFITLQ